MAGVNVPPPRRKAPEAPPARSETPGALDVPTSTERENLNFKVSTAFKREIKSYAASQGMTLIELLDEGFRLVKEKRGA